LPITAHSTNNPLSQTAIAERIAKLAHTVSCGFTALTLIAFYQIHFMKTQDLGMDIRNLVVIKGPAIRDSSFRSQAKLFREKTTSLPFVEKFTASGSVPGIGSGHNFGTDGITGASVAKGADKIQYSISEVDEQYFDTYRIPIVAGNSFSPLDVSLGFGNDRLIVNETAARMLGYDPQKAVGNKVSWDKTYTIIGVVKDYHHRSLKEPIEPILYIGARNNGYYTIYTDPSRLPSKMAAISAIYRDLYPGNSFSYTSVSDTFDRLYSADQRTATLALTLSVLVILIAALGLVGLATFTARRRTMATLRRRRLDLSADHVAHDQYPGGKNRLRQSRPTAADGLRSRNSWLKRHRPTVPEETTGRSVRGQGCRPNDPGSTLFNRPCPPLLRAGIRCCKTGIYRIDLEFRILQPRSQLHRQSVQCQLGYAVYRHLAEMVRKPEYRVAIRSRSTGDIHDPGHIAFCKQRIELLNHPPRA
jgi:hypothetical protein